MNSKHKHNVSRQYLLSYLIVSIIPILLLSFVYLYTSIVKLKNNVDEVMLDRLDLIKNNIDLRIKNMESSSMHFSSNYKLVEDYKLHGINDISRQLKYYKENYPFADQVLFYLRGGSDIFTTEENMPYYQFQTQLGNEVNLDMTEFFSNLYSSTKSRLIRTRLSYPNNSNAGKYIMYIHPVPLLDTQPWGTLAFLIENSKFQDVVVDCMGDLSGQVFIIDSLLNTIYRYSSGMEILPDIERKMYTLKGVGISNQTISDKKYVTVRTVSEYLGYSYILVMPYNKFYDPIWEELNFLSYIIGIVIIVAVIMAILITIKTSSPINKLINNLIPQGGNKNDGTEGNNVFQRIEYEYKNILTRNNELLLQVGNQHSMVRDQLLTGLLCGSYTNRDDIDLNMKCANITFDYSHFFVLFIKLNEKSIQSINMITDYLYKIYFKNGSAYGVDLKDGSGLALIANINYSENDNEIDVRKNTSEMFINMLAQYDIKDVIVGGGGIYRDIRDIDMSFIEAEKSASDGSKTDNIILYPLSVRMEKTDYIQPASEKAIYYKSLINGNEDAALTILNTMIKNIQNHANSFVRLRSFCFYISNTIIEAANIIEFDIPENKIAKSAAYSNLEEFHQCAIDITIDMCKYVVQQQAAKSDQIKNKIVEYVAENFCDYDISITGLAQKFKLSESYLGKFFKNETGHSFMQYITMLRMDYIKQKLITTDMSVKDIVESAGYLDTANFIRKFKISESLTPGQFREIFGQIRK